MSKPTAPISFFGTGWILPAILLFGFVLRLWGAGFGLPYLYHADEPIVVNHALAYSTGDLNPHFFRIPPLASYLLFAFYGLIYVSGNIAGFFQSPGDYESLFYSDPSLFYLSGRIFLGVLPGTLTIYLLYRLARKFIDTRSCLLSAFFLAVAFLHVRDSHYIYADMLLILTLVAAFFFIVRLSGEPDRLKTHLLCGLWIGTAAAAKYNGIALVVPYLAASLARGGRKRLLFLWALSGAACIGIFILLNPFSVLDWRYFLDEIRNEGMAHEGGTAWLHHLTYSLSGAVGWPMILAAAAGFLTVLCKKKLPSAARRCLGLAAVFIAAYYFFIVFKGQNYDRYVLPIIPFICLLAGCGVSAALPKKGSWYRLLVLGILTAVIAATPLTKSLFLGRILSAKDVRTQAKEWVEENIPPGSRIALDIPFYMPRLTFTKEQLRGKLAKAEAFPHFSEAKKRKLRFLMDQATEKRGYELYFLSGSPSEENDFVLSGPYLPFDLEALREKNVAYVIRARAGSQGRQSAFWNELQREAELVRRFTPYKSDSVLQPFDEQPLTGAPVLWDELRHRARNGQPLEIYKLEPLSA